MRCIDADALQRNLNGQAAHAGPVDMVYIEAFQKLVEDQPTVDDNNLHDSEKDAGWISVKDRLPVCEFEQRDDDGGETVWRESGPVFCWTDDGCVIGYLSQENGGDWWCDAANADSINVTHWMQLPEGPED